MGKNQWNLSLSLVPSKVESAFSCPRPLENAPKAPLGIPVAGRPFVGRLYPNPWPAPELMVTSPTKHMRGSYCGWAKSISHHLRNPEMMTLRYMPTNNCFPWFPSGAGFRPSKACGFISRFSLRLAFAIRKPSGTRTRNASVPKQKATPPKGGAGRCPNPSSYRHVICIYIYNMYLHMH